jgi:hypothetical protein
LAHGGVGDLFPAGNHPQQQQIQQQQQMDDGLLPGLSTDHFL